MARVRRQRARRAPTRDARTVVDIKTGCIYKTSCASSTFACVRRMPRASRRYVRGTYQSHSSCATPSATSTNVCVAPCGPATSTRSCGLSTSVIPILLASRRLPSMSATPAPCDRPLSGASVAADGKGDPARHQRPRRVDGSPRAAASAGRSRPAPSGPLAAWCTAPRADRGLLLAAPCTPPRPLARFAPSPLGGPLPDRRRRRTSKRHLRMARGLRRSRARLGRRLSGGRLWPRASLQGVDLRP